MKETGVEGPITTTAAPARAAGRLKINASLLRAYTMVIALVALWLIFNYMTGGTFLTARNLSNLVRQTSVTGILAVGMLMVIVAGQIDLSVGSLVGLTGGLMVIAQGWLGLGFVPSLAVALLVGLAIGAFQGSLVAYGSIPAFIVTLGGLQAWRGALKGATKGNTIPVDIAAIKSIGQDYVSPPVSLVLAGIAVAGVVALALAGARSRKRLGLAPPSGLELAGRIVVPSVLIVAFVLVMNRYAGIPIPVLILAGIALIGAVITQRTTFGRYLYAIGGNSDAARLSGINIKRHILAVFCLMGLLTGVAGIVYTARVGSGSPDAGVLLELDAIAACVIGGASLVGGRGTVLGACLGALFMASLDNGMSLQNVEDYKMDITKGAILVIAVGVDMLGRRKS
jgi:D-xylose transport system permease protein